MRLWMWKYRGRMLCGDAFRTRKQAMQFATERGMGANDYERMGHLEPRWKDCYRRGHRIVRVTVSESGD